MSRSAILRASLCLALSACGNGRGGDGPPAQIDNPLVANLDVSEVAFFQTLKTSISGKAATADAVPIVAGKAGMLRVYVAPKAGYVPHEVLARVELTGGGKALTPIEQKLVLSTSSVEGDLTTTVNFDLTAEQVTADLTFSVGLYEPTSGDQQAGAAGARYPAAGEAKLGAIASGVVKINLIPIAYGADGSNRVPATDAAMLASFKARMMALYPVTDVDITVGSPIPWTRKIGADGSGWDSLLNAMINQRARDGAAPDVYYYAVFAPAANFDVYCQQGCVLGLSPVADDPMDEYSRVSIGVSYPGKDVGSDETFVHEVGHAHGRQHAPCDVTDEDPSYPYADAAIGSWGYDAAAKLLYDPAGQMHDMMGYCDPIWISDYTYDALFTRVRAVDGVQPERRVAPARWKSIVIGADGTPTRGEVVTMARPPMGRDKTVHRVTRAGTDTVVGRYYAFDHLPGGILFVRESDDVGTLRVDGLKVE